MSVNEIDVNAVNERSRAAALLGKKGGQSTSPAKQAAARLNGKKGGKKKKYERNKV